MRYMFDRMHVVVLVFATIALIFMAIVSFATTSRFRESEHWVSHTHVAETAIMGLRADLFASQDALRAEAAYSDPSYANLYNQSEASITSHVADLRRLTSDNIEQQSRLDSLDALIKSRRGALPETGASALADPNNKNSAREILTVQQAATAKALAVLNDMREAEEQLLRQRIAEAHSTYERARIALAGAYAVVVLVLFVYFRGLIVELRNRRRAEETLRALSGRILRMQDAERRKIARELHDSFGQTFAALSMNLDQLAELARNSSRSRELIAECTQMIERSMEEARTLSHLLHPPLLDELGFASAAQTFIEGFSDRSHLKVNVDLRADLQRMPDEVELTLFRALQESLTNVHRHSGSPAVDIRLERDAYGVVLSVRDYGTGISADLLKKFENRTGGAGVGLAGLRERVRELKGELTVRPAHPGTLLRVSLPLPESSPQKPPSPSEAVEAPEAKSATAAAQTPS